MSILPTEAQGSTTSSSLDSSTVNPNSSIHGHRHRTSPPQSSPALFHRPETALTGSLASIADDSSGSSRKVNESGTPNGKRSLAHQNAEAHSQSHSGCRGFGSSQSRGKMSGAITSPQSQKSAGSTNSRGGSMHSSGKRAHMTNANHLLNFHYDPIARPQPRPPTSRRPQKTRPYNKDLFLQANYKFVVLDTGSYSPELMDPDKTLRWDDIICVRYSTTFTVQCPVCLEYPLCPQITSCGHIFCFPCILQYLLMGEENHKADCFKRCPLCFVMISPKELYTIYIENVKQYRIGDTIEFMLLSRQKDSFVPSQKHKEETDMALCCNDNIYDPYSKFAFTSDVELSVRKAILDLDSWLVKADSGLVDDLEKLPYVCAAMEQLEQRKKYWNELRASSDDRFNVYTSSQKGSQGLLSTSNAASADPKACISRSTTPSIDVSNKDKMPVNVMVDAVESLEEQDVAFSSSYDESNIFRRPPNGYRGVMDKDSYNFYQATDGQHLILHPVNMKCLLHHYGSYDMLPNRISGRILQLETVTQSEAMRRRYRYLSHFSLTTTFQLCEIDLSAVLPPDALSPFMDEIKKREKQRTQLARKERKEKIKAEASEAASIPILYGPQQSSYNDSPNFSMEDFEALGVSSSMSSSPPVVGERILFSNVARLGFAAGHDSPSLKIEEIPLQNSRQANDSSGLTGSRNSGTPSFANVTSRLKSEENLDASKVNEISKKGKKPSRVLLSTTSGRRY